MIQNQVSAGADMHQQGNITLIYSHGHRNEVGNAYSIQINERMQEAACKRDNGIADAIAGNQMQINKALEPKVRYFRFGSEGEKQTSPVTLLVSPPMCFKRIDPLQNQTNNYALPCNQKSKSPREADNEYGMSSVEDEDKVFEVSYVTEGSESSKMLSDCSDYYKDEQSRKSGTNRKNLSRKCSSEEIDCIGEHFSESANSQNDSEIIHNLQMENDSLRKRVQLLESYLFELMPNESLKKEMILYLEKMLKFVKKNQITQNEENKISNSKRMIIEQGEMESQDECESVNTQESNTNTEIKNNNSRIKQQLISTNNINMSINQQPCIFIPNNATPPIIASNLAQIHLNNNGSPYRQIFNEDAAAISTTQKYNKEIGISMTNASQVRRNGREDMNPQWLSPTEKKVEELITPIRENEEILTQQLNYNRKSSSTYMPTVSLGIQSDLSKNLFSSNQSDEIEINESSGIFLPRQVLNQFREQARDSPTHYMRKLLSIFFDQQTFAHSSARGKGTTHALNPRITAAVWNHTISEYPTCSMTTLVEDTNRRCAEARRTINRQCENNKYQTPRHRRNAYSSSFLLKKSAFSKSYREPNKTVILQKHEIVEKLFKNQNEKMLKITNKTSSSSSEGESTVVYRPVCVEFNNSNSICKDFSPHGMHEETRIIPVYPK